MEQNLDLYFMKKAFDLALKAYEKDEVPVGAILTFQNKLIAKGHNQVETLTDPTAHAEMICITAGANYFSNWRLGDTTLYTTLEPCLMCAGAIYNARIKRVVYAASDSRMGAAGSWINVFNKSHPMHSVEIDSGIMEEEVKQLMQSFFQKVRKNKAEAKKIFSV